MERAEKYVLYGGDVVLEFNEEEHVYRREGRKVPSTTQITKVIEKSVLLFWAVKVQAEWLAKQWMAARAYTSNAINAILKRSKYQHKIASDEATTIGSQVHNWIESFVNLVMATGHKEKFPAGWNDIPLPDTLEGIYSCNAFLNWYAAHEVVFIQSEKKVYSLIHNYSGTYDLKAWVNGVLMIVDFKTSKAMYEDYYIQLSAYVTADHEEMDYMESAGEDKEDRADEAIILRVPKDGSPYEVGTIIVDTPLFESYFKLFEASRVIYDWQEKFSDEWQVADMKPTTKKGKKKDIQIYLPYIQ